MGLRHRTACYVQDGLVISTIAFLRKFPLLKVSLFGSVWLALQAALFTEAVPLWLLAKFQVWPLRLLAKLRSGPFGCLQSVGSAHCYVKCTWHPSG
jgi:hypothetical protein